MDFNQLLKVSQCGAAAVGSSAQRSGARFNPSRPPSIDRPIAGFPEYLVKVHNPAPTKSRQYQ